MGRSNRPVTKAPARSVLCGSYVGRACPGPPPGILFGGDRRPRPTVASPGDKMLLEENGFDFITRLLTGIMHNDRETLTHGVMSPRATRGVSAARLRIR